MIKNPQNKLDRSFFIRPVEIVAKDLLGKTIVFGKHFGIITETEAYCGFRDEACHAFRGPTPRTKVMFGPAGFSYVYFIYGMYYCLNIVTGKEGVASAVLIRGLRVTSQTPHLKMNGPGKLCRELGINKDHNGIDIVSDPNFYMIDAPQISNFKCTPRIGISKAKEKLWRFVYDL